MTVTVNAAAQLPIPAMFDDSICTTEMLCQPPNDFPSHPFAHEVINPDTSEAMEYHDRLTNQKQDQLEPALLPMSLATSPRVLGDMSWVLTPFILSITNTFNLINRVMLHMPMLFVNYGHRKKKSNTPISQLEATSLTTLAK